MPKESLSPIYLVEYSLFLKKPLTSSIATFCLISSITMAFVD